MDLQQLVEALQKQVAEAAASPLAIPMAGSLAALVFTILLLYLCAVGDSNKEKKAREAGGTVFEHGVRRTTRQVGGCTKLDHSVQQAGSRAGRASCRRVAGCRCLLPCLNLGGPLLSLHAVPAGYTGSRCTTPLRRSRPRRPRRPRQW